MMGMEGDGVGLRHLGKVEKYLEVFEKYFWDHPRVI